MLNLKRFSETQFRYGIRPIERSIIRAGITKVWIDGSCDPKTNPPIATGANWFGWMDRRNKAFTVPGKQTCQRAEAESAAVALETTVGTIIVYTDSEAVFHGAYKSRNVAQNLDIYNRIWREMSNRKVLFTKVQGHSDNEGNNEADRMCKEFMRMLRGKQNML
jgi:ribonuclease HI